MSIPVDVYEALEDALGKESARKLVHGIEAAVEATTTVKLANLRDELFEKLVTKEVFLAHMEALRAYIDQQIGVLQARMDQAIGTLRAQMEQQGTSLQAQMDQAIGTLRAQMEQQGASLQAQIEALRAYIDQQIGILRARIDALETESRSRYDRLNLKLNVVLVFLLLLLTVMNPTFADLLKSLLGLS